MKSFLFLALIGFIFFACNEVEEIERLDCVEVENETCICTQDYSPVCGCNDKTYANKCNAECVGILEYTEGECPDKKSE